jgi:hypothetical protein
MSTSLMWKYLRWVVIMKHFKTISKHSIDLETLRKIPKNINQEH